MPSALLFQSDVAGEGDLLAAVVEAQPQRPALVEAERHALRAVLRAQPDADASAQPVGERAARPRAPAPAPRPGGVRASAPGRPAPRPAPARAAAARPLAPAAARWRRARARSSVAVHVEPHTDDQVLDRVLLGGELAEDAADLAPAVEKIVRPLDRRRPAHEIAHALGHADRHGQGHGRRLRPGRASGRSSTEKVRFSPGGRDPASTAAAAALLPAPRPAPRCRAALRRGRGARPPRWWSRAAGDGSRRGPASACRARPAGCAGRRRSRLAHASSRSSARSTAGAEWVSAPTEIRVRARPRRRRRTVSSVTPPETSSSAVPPQRAPPPRRPRAGDMLSRSSDLGARRERLVRAAARLSTSTSTRSGCGAPGAGARAPPRRRRRTAAMWLSLIRMPEPRSARWLHAAADAHRVLVEHAPAGQGLARVDDARRGCRRPRRRSGGSASPRPTGAAGS